MRKVANKKVIRTLSWRTIKEKKWKNLIAVLAVALTSLLFTALFTVGGSMIDSMQEATFRQVGTSAHGGYKSLTTEEYERIRTAGGYQDISFDVYAGFAVNPNLKAIQTEVRYGEDKMARWAYCYPEEGKMPENINECATSSKVLEALGIPLKVGEKVPLTISTHDAMGNEKIIEYEFVLSGYWYSNDASHAQELWIARQWLDENIELVMQNYNERMKETGAYSQEGYLQANIWFDTSFDIERQMEKLTQRAGYSSKELTISVNWAYMTATVDGMSIFLGTGLILIIILSGYLIIYNIFYINVTADIRYYGLLKTIGTTGRQLRRIVHSQALILSAAGIPLGLFAGYFAGRGILPAVFKATDTGGVTNVVMHPWIFVGASVFALFVVYLSCIKPCRLASRVSPIEAVRYAENVSYKKKEKKSARVSIARMASANMGRNKKKAAVVIASLSLSLTLLNATYCLVEGFSFEKYVQDYLITDMQLGHFSSVNFSASHRDYWAITPEVLEDLKKVPGIEAVNVPLYMGGSVTLPENVIQKFTSYSHSEEAKDYFFLEDIVAQVEKGGQTSGSYYCLTDSLLSALTIKEGVFDKEKFEKGGYAILLAQMDAEKWLSVGDKITAGSTLEEDGPLKELEIMAVASLPYSISTRSYFVCGAAMVMCSNDFEELFEAKGGLYACMDIEDNQEEQVISNVNALIAEKYPELVLTTRESLRKEFDTEINMFSVIGGCLGLILAVIGILNLINAMVTSILARRQEFAMMQAVGMTGKQLKGMLTMEGIWYGVWTLAVTATLGNVVSYSLTYILSKNMAYFDWGFHVLPLLASIPVIGLISVVLPVICYHTLCKRSIIERLRLAEI